MLLNFTSRYIVSSVLKRSFVNTQETRALLITDKTDECLQI